LLVVGITGSVGKTSTKETVASVLERSLPTYRSAGNLNSEIGLPLSLLEVTPEHGAAVLEMGGAYAFGEIRLLAEIAQPRIGVVTNVHPVHLERMGTVEAIAETKAELVDAIPEDGWAILNGDDARVRAMAERCRGRVLFYGLDAGNDVRATEVESEGLGGTSFWLHVGEESNRVKVPLIGGHAVELALAAIAVGHATGMDLADMLMGLAEPDVQVRLLIAPGPNGSQMIDDTYNASTPSVMSALGLLDAINPKRAIAVLGDMRELGEVSEREHVTVGRRAGEVADLVVTFGELARTIAREAKTTDGRFDVGPPAVTSFGLEQREELIDYLLRELREGDVVLLKGSRGLAMENIVERLRVGSRESEVGSETETEQTAKGVFIRDPARVQLAISRLPTSDIRLPTLGTGHGQHHAGRSEPEHGVSLALAGLAFVVTLIIGRPIVTFLRMRKAAKQVASTGRKPTLSRLAPRPWVG
jgi:UDP-N-acetylmuramoyl-tripeptide--D-alanyl-D-alanine ligase